MEQQEGERTERGRSYFTGRNGNRSGFKCVGSTDGEKSVKHGNIWEDRLGSLMIRVRQILY